MKIEITLFILHSHIEMTDSTETIEAKQHTTEYKFSQGRNGERSKYLRTG